MVQLVCGSEGGSGLGWDQISLRRGNGGAERECGGAAAAGGGGGGGGGGGSWGVRARIGEEEQEFLGVGDGVGSYACELHRVRW